MTNDQLGCDESDVSPVKTVTEPNNEAESSFGTPRRWFLRGVAGGLLLMASLNAVSYFVRSSTWGSLVGKRESPDESIGFPLKIWEGGNTYGGLFVDYPKMLLNGLLALSIACVIGWILSRYSNRLNELLGKAEEPDGQKKDDPAGEDPSAGSQPLQFSLFGLMILTTVAAVLSMLASRFAARRETLVAIYAAGPIALVVLAMLPRRLHWQHRVTLIIPATFALIGLAIGVGSAMQMEFDKVLLGIFLCWTPQSAVAATALTIWIFVALSRQP